MSGECRVLPSLNVDTAVLSVDVDGTDKLSIPLCKGTSDIADVLPVCDEFPSKYSLRSN